jgi:hypothetical protein
MSDAVATDRKATAAEVRAHGAIVHRLAAGFGLAPPRLRDDGAVVIHSPAPGYRAATRLSASASEAVGAYVHVITDDVPAAATARPL